VAMSCGCHITEFTEGGSLLMKIFFEDTSYTQSSMEEGESPAERFVESQKLWEVFVLLGGDYDPEPDTQSPFNIFKI